ncbi:MAG TPA: hypothetical protein VL485_11645 [Ktedonobacteraceae bacterium]|nr:hypothetical protein [Ktedonobacteraceae bacterium]
MLTPIHPVESPFVCDRADDENLRSESNPVADEVGGDRPRSQTSGNVTEIRGISRHFCRVAACLQ